MNLLVTSLLALLAVAAALPVISEEAENGEEGALDSPSDWTERRMRPSLLHDQAAEKAHPAAPVARHDGSEKQWDSSSAMSHALSMGPQGQMAAGFGGAMGQQSPFGNNAMTMTGSMAGGPSGSAMGFGGAAEIMGHKFSFGTANTGTTNPGTVNPGTVKRDVERPPFEEPLEDRLDRLAKKMELLTRKIALLAERV